MGDRDEIDAFVDLLRFGRGVRRSLARPDIPATSPAEHFAALADRERGDRQLADRVIVVADLWALLAGEQLAAIAAVLAAGEPIFAVFPLSRSVIEHSCAVVWVLDPTLSPEARCARAALAIERSHQELCAVASRLGGKGSATHNERRRILRDFRAQVERDFPQGTNWQDGVVAGESLATPTDVVRHFGDRWGEAREWQGVYDYLCATCNHPTLSAFEFFGLNEAGVVDAVMPLDFLNRLLRATLVAYLKALEHYAKYCEWDEGLLDALIDQANQVFPDVLSDPAS